MSAKFQRIVLTNETSELFLFYVFRFPSITKRICNIRSAEVMAIQLNEKNVFTQVHLILKHFLKEGKKITIIKWECSILQRKETGFRSCIDKELKSVSASDIIWSFGQFNPIISPKPWLSLLKKN